MQLTGHEIIILLGSLLGGGVAVSLAAQFLKKVFKLKVNEVIHAMVVAVSIVAAGAQYLVQFHAQLPPYVLGISATSLYGASQLTYRYAGLTKGFLGRVKNNADGLPEPTVPVTSETPAHPSEASF